MAKKNEEIDIQSQLLLRELEDEHRRAQMAKLWKAYAPYVLAVAGLIVVGVGGFKVWQTYTQGRIADLGARYEAALEKVEAGAPDDVRKAFGELADGGSRGYATLARLQLAALDLKAGDTVAAVTAFEAVASDASVDTLLRGFAGLQAAVVRSETADWTEMQNRLNDLVVDTSPWRFSARELWGIAALKAGKLDEARRSLEQLLGDRNTPPSIGQRAQILMGQIVASEMARGPGAIPATKPGLKKE